MAVHSWPSSDIMNALEVESSRFRLVRKRERSQDGNAQPFTKDLAPTVWGARVQSGPMYHDQAEQVMALAESMEDQMKSFYVWNPALPFPQADPTGAIYGSSTPTLHTVDADNKRIRIQGLPAGYVLTRGDGIEIVFASPARRMRVVAVDATITADGSGITPLFEVSPHLRVGIATSNAVNLIRPKVAMKIIPGTLDCQADGAFSRISFETEEVPNENL